MGVRIFSPGKVAAAIDKQCHLRQRSRIPISKPLFFYLIHQLKVMFHQSDKTQNGCLAVLYLK